MRIEYALHILSPSIAFLYKTRNIRLHQTENGLALPACFFVWKHQLVVKQKTMFKRTDFLAVSHLAQFIALLIIVIFLALKDYWLLLLTILRSSVHLRVCALRHVRGFRNRLTFRRVFEDVPHSQVGLAKV